MSTILLTYSTTYVKNVNILSTMPLPNFQIFIDLISFILQLRPWEETCSVLILNQKRKVSNISIQKQYLQAQYFLK